MKTKETSNIAPEPRKFLLVESGILDFEIWNLAQEIQNPANDCYHTLYSISVFSLTKSLYSKHPLIITHDFGSQAD